MTTEFDAAVELFGRFSVSVGLLLLLRGSWSGRHFLLGWSDDLRLRRLGHGFDGFGLRCFAAQFAIGGEQAPVCNGKRFLFLLSHNRFLNFYRLGRENTSAKG